MTKSKDSFPYSRFLMIGAFVQLAMAVLLYMGSAINTVVLSILGGITLVCLLLAWKTHKKWARVAVRILFYAVPAFTFLMSLLTLILTMVENQGNTGTNVFLFSLQYSCMTLSLLFQTALLCAIPVFATQAITGGKRCDIFILRLYALLQLATALVTVLYVVNTNMLTLGIDSAYYNVFYCLVCAITALCALAAFPIKTRWMDQLFHSAGRKKGHTEELTSETAEKSADDENPPEDAHKDTAQEEPIKPIFKD